MSSLTAGETIALVIGLVLTVVLIGASFFVLRRLRERRQRLHSDTPASPEVASDRAFNRLAMARTEADLLERQGVDVGRARDLVHLAEASFGRREFDRAFELAQSAHESLVIARRGAKAGGSRSPAPNFPATAPAPAGVEPLPASSSLPPTSFSTPAAAPKVPKNRVESQFEMRLLDGDLEVALRDRPEDAGSRRAVKLRADAQTAYDRADYTESFRLALRGRREVGGKVETLAPRTAQAGGSVSGAAIGGGANPTLDAERVAESERCPQCGHPNLPSDVFCRGCGAPKAGAACPRCGAPRLDADSFCGRCGEKYS